MVLRICPYCGREHSLMTTTLWGKDKITTYQECQNPNCDYDSRGEKEK